MTYIYQYDVAAVLLTAALLLLIVTRREYPSLCRWYFLGIVVSNGVAGALDVASAYCIDSGSAPLWVTVVLNTLYMVVHALTALLFVLYAFETRPDEQKSSIAPIVAVLTYLLVALLCATSQFTHFVFWVGQDGYTRGPFFMILYLYSFFCLLAGCAYLLKGYKDFSDNQTPSILVSAAIIVCVLIVQAFNPQLLLESFGISVMTLQVYYFSEVGSAYMLQGTYCFNRVAFKDYVDARMKRSEPMSIIGVAFMDTSLPNAAANLELPQQLAKALAAVLHKALGQKSVFYLQEGCFAVVVKPGAELGAHELIKHAVEEKIVIEENQISLDPRFCLLAYPGPVFTASQAESALVYALDLKAPGQADTLVKVDKAMLARQHREAQIELALRTSLEDGSLVLHFQPIRTMASGKYESAEVLVRLWDKELGMIYPSEFIPFAEENGLVNKLGEQVLRKACAFYKKNELEARGVKFLEVNLSAVQLLQSDLPERLLGIIREEGVDPQSINLEITETAMVKDAALAQQHMEAMCAQGVTFSLDDYGVGASSARNIYRLPLSVVKLDMSIVQDAVEDERARTLLKHMTNMLGDFDKVILAEGVETQEAADMLLDMGVTHIQGYLYSRPLNSLNYLEFLGVQQGNARPDGVL